MNWNRLSKWIRQSHRWVSIAFAIAVITNFAGFALGKGEPPPDWVVYSPLLPLAFLLFSGLYMFALPYVTKWRTGRGMST